MAIAFVPSAKADGNEETKLAIKWSARILLPLALANGIMDSNNRALAQIIRESLK